MEPLPYDVPRPPDDPSAEERPPALGVVLEEDRGSLPFSLLHGESLVACAGWALGEAGVTALDLTTGWSSVRESDEPLVLHDVLCPATPPWFLAACVRTCLEHDAVVVGVRPVTDTVKDESDGLLGATHDREELAAVASPVVLPAGVVQALESAPGHDLAALVEQLRADHPVRLVEAPGGPPRRRRGRARGPRRPHRPRLSRPADGARGALPTEREAPYRRSARRPTDGARGARRARGPRGR